MKRKMAKINIFPHLLCMCVYARGGDVGCAVLAFVNVCKRILFAFIFFSLCGLLCVVFLDFNFHILAGLGAP